MLNCSGCVFERATFDPTLAQCACSILTRAFEREIQNSRRKRFSLLISSAKPNLSEMKRSVMFSSRFGDDAHASIRHHLNLGNYLLRSSVGKSGTYNYIQHIVRWPSLVLQICPEFKDSSSQSDILSWSVARANCTLYMVPD